MKPVDVDLDDVLDDVSRVLRERETGRSQTYRSEVRETEDVIYLLPGAWQKVSDSLLALDQSLTPLEEPPAVEPRGLGRLTAAVKRLVKSVIQKSVYWYVNPVVAQLHSVHGASDRALHEIADLLSNINGRLEQLEKENLAGRVAGIEGERFDERIGRLERAWRWLSPGGLSGTGAGGAAPSGESAGAEAAPRRVGRDRTVERERPLPPFHFDYYWFESIHRGDRALVKSRQQPYLEYFIGCENVLDIGCGRGEFLELLAERGIGAYGIDIESDAVQYCADAGLNADRAEAIAHLQGLEDESLDGAFISQVAEHMTPSELIEMVGLLHRKLKDGGHVVIETPNPQCLLIFASFFYADLSHVQPIHPETMRFLLLSAGFRDVEVRFTNPVPKGQRLARLVAAEDRRETPWVDEINRNIDKINSVLFGYMDYAAIARK